MIRVGRIWGNLCSVQNATTAVENGTVNKRTDHVVRRKLGYVDNDPKHVGKLHPEKVRKYALKRKESLERGFRPSPMKHMIIVPPCGKEREIDCPCLADHIIHWMLIQAINEPLMRGMYEHSYGSIPGRGIDGARRTIERWVQHDTKSKYFVKLDIRKFYQSVDHDCLKGSFRRVIKDVKTLELIDSIIDCVPSGLPIGTYTSQWFANFFLQPLDHHITQDMYKLRRGKRTNYVSHYLRYMDDMFLMGTSRRDLEKAVREIIRYCNNKMQLDIKKCWEIRVIAERKYDAEGKRVNIPGTAPIDIVGYRFYRDHTEVRGSIFLHTSRLATKIANRLDVGYVLLHDAQALVSLCGWFEHADSEWFLAHYVNNRVNVNFVKEVISYADKNGIVGTAARVFCDKRGQNGGYNILYGRSGGQARGKYSLGSRSMEYELPLEFLLTGED